MTRTGDGDIASQGIAKTKRSMKKCEACRVRKIACLPKDREWSENVKEPCNNCDKLDLPCGPSIRSNAKVESGPRKLVSKKMPEASAADPRAASYAGVSRPTVPYNESNGIRKFKPPELRAQLAPSIQGPEREASRHATISENQNPDIEMTLETGTPEQNFRIYGAAGNSQTTYDSAAISKASERTTLAQPSFVSSHPSSVQSRSARMDELQQPGAPVPPELRPQNEIEAFENAQVSADTLHQPEVLDLSWRLNRLEHNSLPNRQSADTDPSAACGLLPLRSDQNFRVLELLPGHSSAPLTARLTEVNFECRYEALSYVWDVPSFKLASVDRANDDTVNAAAIAPNLASALRALRYVEKSRLLWIDTLCINQTDMVEKNAQTTRMGEIFRSARNICIWLGPESKDTHLAFELIEQSTDLGKFDARLRSPTLVPYWESFTELMRMPWFRRLWAIQEIAFAKDAVVHCGSLRVGWKHLKRTIELFSTQHHDLRRHLRPANERLLDDLRNVCQLDANRFIQLVDKVVLKSEGGDVLQYIQPLDSLVFRCACFECGDPRDTIYALLGLSRAEYSGAQPGNSMVQAAPAEPSSRRPDEDVCALESFGNLNRRSGRQEVSKTSKRRISTFDAIKIDYAKPVFEVCRDFFLYTVEHSRSLDIICRPWAPNSQALPSWMPTVSSNPYVIGKDAFYRRAHADPLVGDPSLDGVAVYNAAAATGPVYHYDAVLQPRELRLSGFVCGTVFAKRLPAMAGIIPSQWFDLDEWLGVTEKNKNRLWRTLVADRGPESRYPPPVHYDVVWDYVYEQRRAGSNLDTTELRAVEEESYTVSRFLERVQSVIWGRRLLLAAVGGQKLLALGPEHTKKRDLICILYGCKVPVLLRKVDGGGQGLDDARYRLVGECYVDGIMNGEALSMKDEHFWPERTFKLV